MPAAGAGRREAKVRGADDVGQRPVGVVFDIGGEAERRAWFQHTGQFAQRRSRNEAALVMAGLWPGIGIKQISGVEALRRQGDQQLQRIVREQPDITEALLIDLLHELCYAARKNLGTDETGIGLFGRKARQMLAAAIADLEDDAPRLREQRARIKFAVAERDFETGQDVPVERVLAPMQALAGAAAEEGARLAGSVERVMRLFGQAASAFTACFSEGTRSIFSQLNEPSRPGFRPKWP